VRLIDQLLKLSLDIYSQEKEVTDLTIEDDIYIYFNTVFLFTNFNNENINSTCLVYNNIFK